ncbi:MAG: thermonuclease family protein [Gammaproteobacteria bacterium]
MVRAFVLACLAAFAGSAFAHGGGLNRDGCHTNRKTGEYHCHRAAPQDPIPTATFSGTVSVTDGDSLKMRRREIRLFGIDAVEHDQPCVRDGQRWACGVAAARALRALLKGQTLECQDYGRDKYGRTLAVCTAGGVDVNDWMVREGWAVAYKRYSTRYVEAENSARDAKKNIWSGKFTMPETYRHRKR